MTSTRSERPGAQHPQHLASLSFLEPAHKGALQNLHCPAGITLASCFSLKNELSFPNVMLQAE